MLRYMIEIHPDRVPRLAGFLKNQRVEFDPVGNLIPDRGIDNHYAGDAPASGWDLDWLPDALNQRLEIMGEPTRLRPDVRSAGLPACAALLDFCFNSARWNGTPWQNVPEDLDPEAWAEFAAKHPAAVHAAGEPPPEPVAPGEEIPDLGGILIGDYGWREPLMRMMVELEREVYDEEGGDPSSGPWDRDDSLLSEREILELAPDAMELLYREADRFPLQNYLADTLDDLTEGIGVGALRKLPEDQEKALRERMKPLLEAEQAEREGKE